MIERLWSLLEELGRYVGANFDPAAAITITQMTKTNCSRGTRWTISL